MTGLSDHNGRNTHYASFVALTGLSAILSIYFGLRAGFGHWAYRKRIKALKGEA